jgi:lysophospholipase
VVDTNAIRALMARWPGSKLELFPGARHEVLMERPPVRDGFCDRAAALFAA